MQTSAEIVLLVPNDWVSEKVLIAVTGLKPGTITAPEKNPGCWAASTCTFHQMVIPSLRANACTTGKPLISGSRHRKKINQVRRQHEKQYTRPRSWTSGGING